jgi:hypothetical protein
MRVNALPLVQLRNKPSKLEWETSLENLKKQRCVLVAAMARTLRGPRGAFQP